MLAPLSPSPLLLEPARAASRFGACAATALTLWAPGVAAAQTGAGSEIVNVATVSFLVQGRPGKAESNPARDRVAEVLAVGAAPLLQEPTPAADGERERAVPFRLTNVGNGREAFALSVETLGDRSAAAAQCTRAAMDSDANGVFGPTDVVYALDTAPVLEAGASVVVFALCDVSETVSDGQLATVKLTATALTGVGAPGRVLPGRGEAGVDAVIGSGGGAGAAEAGLVVALGRPELIKTQTVRDPAGGARVVSGAVVTYTLTARLSGRGIAREVSLRDEVPTGTSYVAGSLILDGQPVSDVADADPGRFTGQAVELALGDIEPSRSRSIQFQVRVN